MSQEERGHTRTTGCHLEVPMQTLQVCVQEFIQLMSAIKLDVQARGRSLLLNRPH
jgi:hypothetical protein